MTTVLLTILVVLIVLNVWLGAYSIRRERQRRMKLQERLDEYDTFVGEHMNNMGVLQQRYDEQVQATAHAKKEAASQAEKYDFLRRDYDKLVRHSQWFEDAYKKLKQGQGDVVDAGEPLSDVGPVGPANKPDLLTDFKAPTVDDFAELRASYEELAKSYNYISQRHENPSKTYLIRNIVKVYDVKNKTQLAKALGVSQQSINKMLRNKQAK